MARSDDKTGIVTVGKAAPAGPAGTDLHQLERGLAAAATVAAAGTLLGWRLIRRTRA